MVVGERKRGGEEMKELEKPAKRFREEKMIMNGTVRDR